MTLRPAYGRDYKSEKAVLADFNANKDFIITGALIRDYGKYVNKEQLPIGLTVSIIYNRLRSVAVVEVKP